MRLQPVARPIGPVATTSVATVNPAGPSDASVGADVPLARSDDDLEIELGHDHDHHHDHGHDHDHGAGRFGWGPGVVAVPFVVALLVRSRLGFLQNEELRLWSTLFVSICLQALPFLALGVAISGGIAAFVSPDLVRRIVPRRPLFAVPAAGAAGQAQTRNE